MIIHIILKGDSGGPVTHKDGDQHVLIGVVSFAAKYPTVCGNLMGTGPCRISGVRDWIDRNLKGANYCGNNPDAGTGKKN